MKVLIKIKLLLLSAMLLCAFSILFLLLSFSFLNNENSYGWCVVIEQNMEMYEPSTFASIIEEENFKRGKSLWTSNCASCHKINENLLGPALAGITNKYEKEWLYKWIRNNQALIKECDALAVKAAAYDVSIMTAFPMLTNKDIDDLLFYIDYNR